MKTSILASIVSFSLLACLPASASSASLIEKCSPLKIGGCGSPTALTHQPTASDTSPEYYRSDANPFNAD